MLVHGWARCNGFTTPHASVPPVCWCAPARARVAAAARTAARAYVRWAVLAAHSAGEGRREATPGPMVCRDMRAVVELVGHNCRGGKATVLRGLRGATLQAAAAVSVRVQLRRPQPQTTPPGSKGRARPPVLVHYKPASKRNTFSWQTQRYASGDSNHPPSRRSSRTQAVVAAKKS